MEADVPDQLRCPICVEIPQKGIFQCKNGHTVCSYCVTSLVTCPQCRVPFAEGKIRNRALEGILDGMQFDCRYKERGCGTKVSRLEFQNHSKNCAHRPPAACPESRGTPGSLNIIIGAGSTVVGSFSGNVFRHLTLEPCRHRRQPTLNSNRNKTLVVDSDNMNDTLHIGHGGHIVHQGRGNITAEGNKQRVELNGRGGIKVEGNVEEGIELNGAGRVEVTGKVQGGIDCGGAGNVRVRGNVQGGVHIGGAGWVKVGGHVEGGVHIGGAGKVEVEGDVYGDIEVGGVGSVTVKGRHRTGRVSRGGFGIVSISNR